MSRSQVVAEHLPLLRRYSRALTGSQSSGDAYVAAMLEALLQDGSLLDERHGPRVGLFRLFTQIWNSVSVNGNSDVATLPLPSERRLSNITPLPRQAFLLLSLEGFSEEEVAFILGTDIAETRKLTDAAGREMAAEIATDVLIIEDETFIAMDLESLVKNLGHNVIGVARTHSRCGGARQEPEARPDPRRHPVGRRLLGPRCRQRAPEDVRGAGGVHHRLSGALPDRRAAGAGVPDLKAVPAGDGVGGGEPGAVLPAQLAQPRAAGGGELTQNFLLVELSGAPERRAGFFVGSTG